MTSRHWLRTPSDEDPEPYSEDECRYCEEVRRENAQVVEINEALHDALHDAVAVLKRFEKCAREMVEDDVDRDGNWRAVINAITDAEIILGGPVNPK